MPSDHNKLVEAVAQAVGMDSWRVAARFRSVDYARYPDGEETVSVELVVDRETAATIKALIAMLRESGGIEP